MRQKCLKIKRSADLADLQKGLGVQMGIYDFEAVSAAGEKVSLSKYDGKVLLVVNTATECGFTPQYDELEALYEKLNGKGFEILEFPCNQFGGQAPGTDAEIAEFCSTKFGIKFPRFSKVDVNGATAHPLFQYLTSQKGFAGFDPEHKLSAILDDILSKANPNYKEEPDIKWNFTKFLVDGKGNVVKRFEPTEDIRKIEAEIEALL